MRPKGGPAISVECSLALRDCNIVCHVAIDGTMAYDGQDEGLPRS